MVVLTVTIPTFFFWFLCCIIVVSHLFFVSFKTFLFFLNPFFFSFFDHTATLLSMDTKVHIVMTHTIKEGDTSRTSLVASYDVEWRKSLVAGGVSIPAELLGAGPRSKLRHPVGVLDLRLDVVPSPTTEIPAGDIDRGLRA